jgi:hypothetical protein
VHQLPAKAAAFVEVGRCAHMKMAFRRRPLENGAGPGPDVLKVRLRLSTPICRW